MHPAQNPVPVRVMTGVYLTAHRAYGAATPPGFRVGGLYSPPFGGGGSSPRGARAGAGSPLIPGNQKTEREHDQRSV